MNNCKNCNEPVSGNYCSKCGRPALLKRVDRHFIIQEIAKAFNLERGMLYTLKQLLIRPGESIRQYITEDRSRYVNPISFLIITSLIYTVVCHFFHIDAKDFFYMGQPEIELPTTTLFINWIIEYDGYASIISGFFIAFWMKLFFRKSGYNLFEFFILICFVSGMATLFFSVLFILRGLTHLNIYSSLMIVMIYYTWATGQFFDRKKAASYIKAFLSYLFGSLMFGFIVAFIAAFIDIATIVMNH